MPRAMLLCAGLSTRLGELGQARPKPLLPVCDIPILRYGITNLVAHGIRDIVINLHHRGELIEEEIGDGSDLGARVRYSREDEILGTGGGLKKALPLLDPDGSDEPFVSCNGKLIFDVDFTDLLQRFQADPGVLGMLVVRRSPKALEWGAVDVREGDGPARVVNILGDGRHMFGGVHVTRPSTVARLPEGEACMVRQGYLPWMHDGVGEVAAYEAPGEWYFAEHSTPERYLQSSLDLLERPDWLHHPPGELTGIAAGAEVSADAVIREPVRVGRGAIVEAGAQVGPRAVIGAGAVVESGAVVKDSVVWPGARAAGTLERAVVTETGTIVPRT